MHSNPAKLWNSFNAYAGMAGFKDVKLVGLEAAGVGARAVAGGGGGDDIVRGELVSFLGCSCVWFAPSHSFSNMEFHSFQFSKIFFIFPLGSTIQENLWEISQVFLRVFRALFGPTKLKNRGNLWENSQVFLRVSGALLDRP